jgi:hypothetical protein
MAVTINMAEVQEPGRKNTFISWMNVDFGAQNDEQIITHAPDAEKLRAVRILDANDKIAQIAPNFFEVTYTSESTTTIKNLVAGASAGITIVVEVAGVS